MDNGGNAVIGAIIVVEILFWAFGGFNGRGGGDAPDVAIDLPDPPANPLG